MTKRSALRMLLAAMLLGVAPGCFVNDEINKASALGASTEHKVENSAVAKEAGGTKTAAATKPGAAANAAAKPTGPTGKAWWQTARSLTSESSGEGISRCELSGGVHFMDHDDCLARGGTPK